MPCSARRPSENFADDPNATLIKLRQLTEQLAQRAAAHSGVYAGAEDNQLDLLRRLEQRGALPRNVADLFHSVRKSGNRAAHDLRSDKSEALQQLKFSRQIAVWFHRTFGRAPGFNPGPFISPSDPKEKDEEIARQLVQLRDELTKAICARRFGKTSGDDRADRTR